MNLFEQGLSTYLAPEQLEKIHSCHIGIGGCGGLGSNTAVLLARSGFCRFSIMDFDTIEASNLNRQYFFLEDVGKSKAACLVEKLHAINPDIICHAYDTRWNPGLEKDPFCSCHILVEAFDGAETKAAFVEYYSDKTNFIVSGNGLAGIGGPPFSVEQHHNIFFIGDRQTAVGLDHPPMAPRVTCCAAMMAETVLTLALNEPFCPSSDG